MTKDMANEFIRTMAALWNSVDRLNNNTLRNQYIKTLEPLDATITEKAIDELFKIVKYLPYPAELMEMYNKLRPTPKEIDNKNYCYVCCNDGFVLVIGDITKEEAKPYWCNYCPKGQNYQHKGTMGKISDIYDSSVIDSIAERNKKNIQSGLEPGRKAYLEESKKCKIGLMI